MLPLVRVRILVVDDDETLARTIARSLRDHECVVSSAPESVIARVDHFPSAFALLHTGIGVALLPEFVAQGTSDIIELSAPIDALQLPLWILTHPDLRNTARVRAFMQTVGDSIAQSLSQK